MSAEEREHDSRPDCWCRPHLFFTTEAGAQVWVHHAPGTSEPIPAAVLAEAIALAYDGQGDVHSVVALVEDPAVRCGQGALGALALRLACLTVLLGLVGRRWRARREP